MASHSLATIHDKMETDRMDCAPEPINDHERAIAQALDSKHLTLDSSNWYMVSEVMESMPFKMSIADMRFLFNYAHWKMAQPAKKQSA